MDEFLLYVKSHPLYEDFEKALLEARPHIPPHDPSEDNTERWKALSAQQRGFDSCLSFFKIGV